MTFHVSNGSRPLTLRCTTSWWDCDYRLLYSDGGIVCMFCFLLCCVTCTHVYRGDRDVWIRVSGVRSYGVFVEGGNAKHVAMSN